MKNLILLFFFFFSVALTAQKVELIQGVHVNKFFGTEYDLRFSNEFTSHTGYTIRFAYQSAKTKKMSWRLALGFQKYISDFRVSDGGNGGGFTVQAKIKKSVLSFIVYPLNLTFWNRLHLNLGLALSTTVNSSFEGEYRQYTLIPSTSITEDLHDKYETYNSFGHFGLTGRLAYDFKLSSKFTLSPQYSYYYGVTSEFQHFPSSARTMRHFYCVGVGWKI